MVEKQLDLPKNLVTVRHLVLDGHFGNNNALQMVLQCGLHLISKLRCDSALYFRFDGKQSSRGPRKKQPQKIDWRNIPEKHMAQKNTKDGIQSRIYQAQMLHQGFAQVLNVVIITKTNLKIGAFANVILFSSDLELAYEMIIDWYSLRFQIEFNFPNAKQHWGPEDFMKVQQVLLTNALNLSLFMVNLYHMPLGDYQQTHPKLEQIFGHVATLGFIHAVNVHASSP